MRGVWAGRGTEVKSPVPHGSGHSMYVLYIHPSFWGKWEPAGQANKKNSEEIISPELLLMSTLSETSVSEVLGA